MVNFTIRMQHGSSLLQRSPNHILLSSKATNNFTHQDTVKLIVPVKLLRSIAP